MKSSAKLIDGFVMIFAALRFRCGANLPPNPDEHCTYATGCTRGYEHVTPLGFGSF